MWLFGKQGRWGSTAQRRRQRSYRRRNHLSLRGGFLERLEDRRLLAITATFAGGVLTFTGDIADDTLTISARNNLSTMVDYNGTGLAAATQAGLTAIIVDLDGGTNTLTIEGSTTPDTALGDLIDITLGTPTSTVQFTGGVPYSIDDVQNLTVDGRANADTISADGANSTVNLLIDGGADADSLSIPAGLTASALTVQDPTPTDDIEVNGTITTTAAAGQDYRVPVTLTGPTTLNSGAGPISFSGTVTGTAFALLANSTGTTTFGGAVMVASLQTNAGGQTRLHTVTTNASQQYLDAVLLTQDAVLTSNAANIIFNGFVDAADNGGAGSAHGLTVNTPAGNNEFHAAVGGNNQAGADPDGLEFLTTDDTGFGGQTILGVANPTIAILTTGDQEYNDPVLLMDDTVLTSTGGNITFNNFVDAADNLDPGTSDFGLTVNTPLGNNVFNFEVGGDNQDLLLTPSDADGLEFLTTDATGAGGQTQFDVAAPLIAVTTTGEQRYGDNVLLNADTILVASDAAVDGNDNVIFEGTITAVTDNAQFLVVNANDVTRFEGNVGSSGLRLESLTTDLAPFAASGTTEFGRIASPVDLTVFTAGDQTFNDNVLLRTDTDLIASNGDITFNRFVDAADNGNATTSAFGLSVNTPNLGDNLFNNEVGGGNVPGSDPNGLEDLTTDSTGVAGQTKFNFAAGPNTVLTTLNQTYNDPVLLLFDTVLTSSAGNITFNNFVDAVNDGLVLFSFIGLTVNTPLGDNTFNQEVGGNNQAAPLMFSDSDGLEFLTTDDTGITGGRTIFNVAAPTFVAVKTTNAQLYQDAVLLEADTILSASNSFLLSASDVTFEQTVRSSTDGANGLNVNATGDTTFQGKVGDNNQRLEFLRTDVNPGPPPAVAIDVTRIEISTAPGEVSINTLLDQTFNDPVIIDSPTDLTLLCAGTDVTFNNKLGGNMPNEEDLIIEVGGTATFNQPVNDLEVFRSLVVRGKGAAPGKTIIRTANFIVGQDMQFDTPVCVDSPTNLTTFTADNDVLFNSTLDGINADQEEVRVQSGRITRFGGDVGSTGRLTRLETDAPGRTELGRAGGAAVTVLTLGEQLYNDAVLLQQDATVTSATANITFNSFVDAADNILFGSLHGLTVNTPMGDNLFNGEVGGDNQNTVLAPGSATSDEHGLEFLITDSTVIAGQTKFNFAAGPNTVLTSVDQTYNDFVLLMFDTVLTSAAGNITFNNFVDAAEAVVPVAGSSAFGLTVNTPNVLGTAGKGNNVFNAEVGGDNQDALMDSDIDGLKFLNTDLTGGVGGQTRLNIAGPLDVLTTGLQHYGDAVLLQQDTELTSSSESVTFANRMDGETADEQHLHVDAATFITFDGNVGTTTRLDHLIANATTGNISLREMRVQDTLAAPEGVIELHADQGAIVDLNGAAGLNTFGHSLIATARDGVELDTELTRLVEVRNTTAGDILIREENTLSVREVVNNAQDAIITSKGHTLTVENVAMIENFGKRNFIISVSDLPNMIANDDVVVAGKIRAEQIVSLIAGDDITLEATSDVRSDNLFVYMKVDVVNVDAVGGTLILLGALQGNNSLQYPLVAEGDTGDDLFSIQKLPQSAIAILARAGTLDNTFIVLTDAAEDVRVFATIVDLAGQSPGGLNPIEITYVDNEQLDLVTLGGDDKVFVQMPEPTHGILANIVRTSTGAGDDSLKVNGSTLNDVIRVNSYTTDPNYRFQVRGDTGETECLQVFGFTGNDIIENAAPIASLLDGGNGQDTITGSDFSIQPATGTEVYDVIFGGGDADSLLDPLIGRRGLSGRAGNDFLYADHDYNLGTPVLTIADGDIVNGGLGMDVIIALGGDSIQRDSGDFESDIVVGQGLGLSINDFLFAQLISPSAANVDQQLQAGLAKKCAMPIP